MDAGQDDLVTTTIRFGRALRARGFIASPAETQDAVRTLALVDLRDRGELRLALRALLALRPEEYPVFDELFPRFFGGGVPAGEGANPSQRGKPQTVPAPALERWVDPGTYETAGEVKLASYSSEEARGVRDLARYAGEDADELRRVARQMARRLATRRSRRWRPARRGPRVHAQRTMRAALRAGGTPIELTWRRRRIRKTRLVVLCDVSGSMEVYARFLLQFLYAMQDAFARVETFVFSTRLARVTDRLRTRTFAEALRGLSADAGGFAGGTRIGASLAAFEAEHGRLVNRDTVVVILSDGWDTGEPELLAAAMRGIHRRAGKVIWLNPLLGNPAYQPLTRGMQAALPHVDVFAPAHDLASLRALVRHLEV